MIVRDRIAVYRPTMVNVVDRPTEAMPSGKRRRWRLVAIIAGCVVVLAAIGVGLGFWRYAATYAPLQEGGFYGPFRSADGVIVLRTTDLGDEVVIRGPAGTEARWIFSIQNNGSFDVSIDKIEEGGPLVRTEWSPYVLGPGGLGTGENLPLRNFPAAVTSHKEIRVVLTLRKPVCRSGLYVSTPDLLVDWHSLGVHHRSVLPFPVDATFVGCPHPPE
jgi:hypothetical protein